MVNPHPQWQLQTVADLPDWFLQAVQQIAGASGRQVAQLLWQRGIRDVKQVAGFIDPDQYQPTSPFAFGQEMRRAVERLQQAWERSQTVAIWGDFDADGITATAVLWDGLGQFFPRDRQLRYYIPNRLTESHGLAHSGIAALAEQGCHLIVTCDTGSTNLAEIEYARELGIDVIVTDHHTLPIERPPVVAIINPRSLPADHPLAHLSGVAVAYKLVEAFYETLPDVPQRPLTQLLDLVAIGLIADLVKLTGDCRYLAQRGIEQLQQNQTQQPPPRPGIAYLLELCRKTGDRPTDISFGIGPRINAISRIQGDARFCVELLTSQDQNRCRELAIETELANARRKSLQKEVVQQAKDKLTGLDLSTTPVIILFDPQWSVGILGLVAGQIAQEYGRPTFLLTADSPTSPLARGSARSLPSIDLYQLMQAQASLLHSFGGHPLAAGLSLPIENIPLLTAALSQQLRQQSAIALMQPTLQADLVVEVCQLGKDLFRELKLLEPYGMGNPVPKLLIQNCWFTGVRNAKIKDSKGNKLSYIKTEFAIADDSTTETFPGLWWGHYREDLPTGRCDAIVELDFNAYQKQYHVRLVAVRPGATHISTATPTSVDWVVDWRQTQPDLSALTVPVLQMTECPHSWDEFQVWFRRAIQTGRRLAIAYPPPVMKSPAQVWQTLVGLAKYLSRTGETATPAQLQQALGIGDRPLQAGLTSLRQLGFAVSPIDSEVSMSWQPQSADQPSSLTQAIAQFLAAVQEEQFRRWYFYEVPLSTIQAMAVQTVGE